MRRTIGMILAALLAAGIVAVPEAAQAATSCSRSWHYITHAETGLNLQPDPLQYQGNTTVYADAVPGTNVWNQQFLFCRDPGWSPNHYAVYSNGTGRYWGEANNIVHAGLDSITGAQMLFDIWKFDSNFWVIRYVGWPWYEKYLYPDHTPGYSHVLTMGQPPLTGNHLFRISPANLLG